jgi:hypothetical protein
MEKMGPGTICSQDSLSHNGIAIIRIGLFR